MVDDAMLARALLAYLDATRGSLERHAAPRAMKAALEAVAPMIRAQAFEEAAQVAELWTTDIQRQFGAGAAAGAIRALEEKAHD